MAPPLLYPMPGGSRSQGENFGESQSFNESAGQSASQSGSYIPNYSQTPILENIAKYAESMAPQVYQWGMDVYGKNQGNIDDLMRTAETYASGQRLAADVGMAESGVQQAGEHALESSKRDLESYGVDPSSGRYAALDVAGRVQTAAAAAGAGNQQRQADIATGNAMRNQALSASLQNAQVGIQGANAANQFLGTAMRLPYAPLGHESQSVGANRGQGGSQTQNYGYNTSTHYGDGSGGLTGRGGGPTQMPGPRGQPKPEAGPREGGGNPPSGRPFGDPGGGGPPGIVSGGGPEPGTGDGSALGQGGIGSDINTGGPYYEPGLTGYEDPASQGWGNWGDGSDGYVEPGADPAGIWGDSGGDTGGWDTSDLQAGGPVPDDDEDDSARFVSPSLSPSNGEETDDVPANLNVGEFVLPHDVVKWKGEEFFQNLIAKSRAARSSIMQAHGQMRGGAI